MVPSTNLQMESALAEIESQLESLIVDLRAHVEKGQKERADWEASLEDFVCKATGIRRMMTQFQSSDLSTRRFVRHHLDEEFEALRETYSSLSRFFTDTV